jgi:hypothetical protein
MAPYRGVAALTQPAGGGAHLRINAIVAARQDNRQANLAVVMVIGCVAASVGR